jgi:SAM-dependent methyltransferase
MNATPALTEMLNIIDASLNESKLVRLTISKPRNKKADLRRITIKPVALKSGLKYSFQYQFERRDETQNVEAGECVVLIRDFLAEQFLEANLFTTGQHCTLISNVKGSARFTTTPLQEMKTPDLNHDRTKQRLISSVAPHWNDLGLTDNNARLLPSMQHKFKQINQYVEILEPLLKAIQPKADLRIVDMGAGKGYLTFALYEYLATSIKQNFHLIGVELRDDLVQKTNAIARKYGYDRLEFVSGNIHEFHADSMHVLIALHACDTATDDAIAAGIKAGAELIVCAPCCHKQIRNEMKAHKQSFPVLQFGILMERQAEILTDTLRALIMEKYGYKSQIQEFIDAGHTPKNLLLTGIKMAVPANVEAIDEKISALKQQFGIQNHYLELALQQ